MTKSCWLGWFLLFSPMLLVGQIFSGSPSSVRWKQLLTPEGRIIFPEGTDSTAQRIAGDIHRIARPTLAAIGRKTKKIDIVLRNTGLNANGYVGLGPFRSEFYLTPEQNAFSLGSTPWPDILAAHEYRHVQQYNNFDVGISHLMRIIFGQEGQALANAASIPDWFFEGDAVYNETLLSGQGRGSLPYFYNGFRALWSSGKNYDWMKLRNGSYRNFIPDKYPLGFMLVTYGREKYGTGFWRDVTQDAARFRHVFYPFQNALKKHSGQSYQLFRDSAFSFFQNKFGPRQAQAARSSYYQNDLSPAFDTSGNLIFLRNSVKKIPRLIVLTHGKEHIIRIPDRMVDDYFSYRNGRIVYAAIHNDLRWPEKVYNEIKLVDVKTGRQKRITQKTRYFSPDISESGDSIIAVNSKVNGSISLNLIQTKTGKMEKEFQNGRISNFAYPKFYRSSILSCVSDTSGQMSIAQIDIVSGVIQYLLPFSNRVIGFPNIRDDTLYFSISWQQNDELFAYTFSDKKVWQIISIQPSIGKYYATADDHFIAWSTFTSQGLQLQKVSVDSTQFKEVIYNELPEDHSAIGFAGILHDPSQDLLAGHAGTLFPVQKYKRLTRPLNFHSLEPAVSSNEISLNLVGENILNTIQSTLSATYNTSNGTKTAGANFVWGTLFPIFTFGYQYSVDKRFVSDKRFIYYNSSEPYLGFYIPINLSRNRSVRSFSFGSRYVFNNSFVQKPFKDKFQNNSFSYLNNYFSISNRSQQALAQVAPRFAQSLYASYRFPAGKLKGYQYQLIGKLFLPGAGATHSLNLTAAYSQKDTAGKVVFSSSFPFARGYEEVNLHKLTGYQINYQLPLFYPEKGFYNLVYFSRLRGNFFYDQTTARSFLTAGEKWTKDFRSAGVEVFFDTKWWNQAFVSFGIRYSHLFDDNTFGSHVRNRWEIIVPVDLFGN